MNSPIWYPIVICTIGGAAIGLFRKYFGDYPQTMKTVIGVVKKTGTYPYRRIVVILIGAILPLIIGCSVGPEAGMVGVIVALGCWVNDNLKFAQKNANLYSKVGMAVSLSALFASPLFGFFSAVENEDMPSTEYQGNGDSDSKLLIYGISIVSSLGMLTLFNHLFGKVSEGFPSFGKVQPDEWDLAMTVIYFVCGEVLAGMILGLVVTWLPVVQFSGESQMAILITDYAKYTPIAMIGIAFLKVLITNMCIQMGLKGGTLFSSHLCSCLPGIRYLTAGIFNGCSPRNICSRNHYSSDFKRIHEKTAGSNMSIVFVFSGSNGLVDFSGGSTCRSGNRE